MPIPSPRHSPCCSSLSLLGHAVSGTRQYNAEQRVHGQAPVSMRQYLGTARFWFESFQNWQSEFLAVGSVVVLSIWLRERGSPESKPVTPINSLSAPISCAEAGIPAAGEHGGQVLRVSAYNPLDEPVTGDTWLRQARSPAARSQNESGIPIILRAGLRWRSWSMPCPRRLRLPPHLAWSPPSRAARTAMAVPIGAESPVAQKLRSRRRETCLYDRHSGAQRAGLEQSLQEHMRDKPRPSVVLATRSGPLLSAIDTSTRALRARVWHDPKPALQYIPYAHTAPGSCLVAGTEACLCDGTFSQLLSAYVS